MKEAESSYLATALHPSLGDEPANGRIVVSRWTLRFESEAGNVELPIAGLQIEFSEEADRVFFSHPDHPDWTIYTYDLHILEHHALAQNTQVRNQIKEVQARGAGRKALIITASFLVCFGIAAALVSWLSGWMVRTLVAKVPVEWEADLGNSLFEEIKTEDKTSGATKPAAELKALTDRLARALPDTNRTFQIHLLDVPIPNAFALPGGHLMVNTGLLEVVKGPEELAGVLAHEMAHVTQRHGFRKIISAMGPFLLARLLTGNNRGLLGVIGNSSGVLVGQTYSRAYENEADDVGWQYLVNANIDPRGMIRALQALKAEEDKLKLSHTNLRGFSSHPPTEARIRRLEAKWEKLKRKTGFVQFDPPGP
ncbi:MAG: M48 family metallopeptidase [Verrucomicrobia bacterium]|nr:M48 family metallopeptidase [Verrucomicrobiota bacterium]